jgi:acetyl-CoA carboxylase carboxyl transferase subunit alpha
MSFAHSRPGLCGGLHTQHQPLRAQPCRQASRCPARQIAVQAKKGVPDPPDTPKQERRGGREWMQTMLARFGPLAEKPENTAVLDFEKPLVELDNRIKEVRKVAEDNGVDVSDQIKELEGRAAQLRTDTYNRLTPVQQLHVARHPNRPTFLDIALNITDKFVELHGDRAGLDDPAMVAGIGSIDGVSFMMIGHQKGRNTKENIHRNFGMPQPNGYRKALRFMRHADKFGFPIITFVDTPGAYAGKNAEELGQGEAIAFNLREMFGLRVPIFSIVIGEGGSGGALAIGIANRSLILEHAVYYVASPEACAAILWKSRDKAATATEALKITAKALVDFEVMDEIIPEPAGGAHANPMAAFPAIKDAILRNWDRYSKMSEEEIKLDRYAKFRKLGHFEEFPVIGGLWRETRAERAAAEGVRTKAGTWALNETEARMIEKAADADERWAASLEGKDQWLQRPLQPPGLLRTGIMEATIGVIEAARRQQAGNEEPPSSDDPPPEVDVDTVQQAVASPNGAASDDYQTADSEA